ncbi:hypothetical protein D3P07_08600 [Paenibacillus sp. 1011MAR3C5]|uniref:hypothetical protein n=1 Tax=Paenibacillus sp. 1011MAR3C5 TaxID=1675787 RepID=UPI000E6C0271|nr:hypothetical protein [Paenibacillus sp. 1011MAR3C5]RJE90256.1 hypothetical protein D3P07_08600 [Paenibacillus sp. 1011MAR3C5]
MKYLAGLLLVALISCSAVGLEQEEKPAAFDFVFSYGVANKNVLDTLQGTYTKDLVKKGTSTTELSLTENEKNQVHTLMKEIGLFGYPNEVEGMNIKPSSGYTFQIFLNGKEQNIHWKGEFNETKTHREFKRLTDTIIEIIRNNEAYQAMPKSDGYYE